VQRDVLFIHGWWSGAWVWSRFVDPFRSAGFRTHALDLPGPETGRSSFSDHLEDALEAARGIGDPVLVGHSAGGLLAMKMCETLDPPACVAITPAAPAGVLPRPSLLLSRFLAAALPSILLGRDYFPRRLLPQIALNMVPPAEQEAILARMRPVSASQVRLIVPSLIRVAPRRVRSPVLIVGAGKDRLTPVAQTRAIARRYGADYREYSDADHFILLEEGWSQMASDAISWIAQQLDGPLRDGA
jgi:pimeloyl-ACP methyl ester carboxylesterase